MSKFLARFGGGSSKKNGKQSPNASPSTSTNARPTTPASPASDRRRSKQLLNFGISSPGNGTDRPEVMRNGSTSTTPSTAPKIELDFGEQTGLLGHEGALQSTGVGLQSPITGHFATQEFGMDSRKENGQQRQRISPGELELLSETRFTWAQVERAWDVAGQELKVIGLKTPDLFRTTYDSISQSTTNSETIDEAHRLLAIFTISTSSSPSTLLASFPSLSDYYPPVSFIPQSQEWHDNDFKTNVGWTKDPPVLVQFLKTVTQQVSLDPSKHVTNPTDGILPEWHHRFAILERKSSYPSDAFSRLLSPLITPDHYRALFTIFDRWAVISANAAFNGCHAREVLCGSLGWWLMGARVDGRQSLVGKTADGGWEVAYRAWEETRDATYHLFMAWIRDQERTGTLPLLVLNHVKGCQERLENRSQIASKDEGTVLECRLIYQPSSSLSTSTYSPTPEDLLASASMALESGHGQESSLEISLRRWQRQKTDDVEAEKSTEVVRMLDVIKAIRDTQYPQLAVQHERQSSTALPRTPTTADSFYRPFRTPSSSSFMNESGTPNGDSSPGQESASHRYATPPRTPYTPTSASTPNATADAKESDPEDWTDFAQMGFGETVPQPKPFVLGEAFKELRIRNGEPSAQSREPRELGMGRPSTLHKNSPRKPAGTYKVDSCDTNTLSAAFIDFQRELQTAHKQTESWPPFGIFHLDNETVRRFDLCANFLLVSVRIAQPETKEPSSIAVAQAPSSIPLQTPPPPPPLEPVSVNHTSSATDAEKRSRRRSFFRSFSGSSSKNRRTSSVNISSPLESPLPAVTEKREPVFVPEVAFTPSPINTPSTIQTPQLTKLSHNDSPQAASLRSRSPSSMYRKPVPPLDEAELRDLGLAGTAGGMEDSSRIAVPHSTDAPNGTSSKSNGTSFPSTTVVDLTESEEFITAESSTASLSVTEDSAITKSPTRKRRSGAPSPASVAPIESADGHIPATVSDSGTLQDFEKSDGGEVQDVAASLSVTQEPLGPYESTDGATIVADDLREGSKSEIAASVVLGPPL